MPLRIADAYSPPVMEEDPIPYSGRDPGALNDPGPTIAPISMGTYSWGEC